MATQNTNQYDVPGAQTFSTGTQAKPTTPQTTGVSAAMPANPNFNPIYQPGNVPANYTGTYRTPEGKDITLNNGQPTTTGTATPQTGITTSQPSPKDINATPFTGDAQPKDVGYDQAFKNLQNSGLKGAELAGVTASLKNHYQIGFNNAVKSGNPAPTDGSGGRSAVAGYIPPTDTSGNLTPAAQTYVSTDPYVKTITDAYNQVNDYMKSQPTLVQQYQTLLDQSGIKGIDAQLMDLNKTIEGTADDIRNEVTKAGGFATDSQVQALAAARDKPLLTKYNSLVALRAQQKDYLDTSVQLAKEDRASVQQRMNQSLDFAKLIGEHADKMQNAAKENYQFAINHGGYIAFAQSVVGDPKTQTIAEQTLGLAPGSLSNPAFLKKADAELTSKLQTAALDRSYKLAEINKINNDITANTPGTPQYNKNQDKLEQQYRTVLLKEVSNRSGGLGLQDQKVNQAIHLMSLADSYKDAKGNYNIPTSQYAELALGLASLISPTGTTAESDRQAINARTAAGDIKGALQYVTGTPQTGNTQAMIKNLVDSVKRQGSVSEDLRNQAVGFLHGLAPTGLDQSRIDALEKNSLSSFNKTTQTQSAPQKLLTPTEIPSGYYQASDGLLYKK